MRKFVKLVDSLCVPALLVVACAAGDGQNGIDSNGIDSNGSCVAKATDDGSSSAASLTSGSLVCSYRSGYSDWASAMSYCKGLGGGYRLPTRGEAVKIVASWASDRICRIPPGPSWGTWTSTCAGPGLAWVVDYSAGTGQSSVGPNSSGALCVR